MKRFLTFLILFFTLSLHAQTISNFEGYLTEADTFDNGSGAIAAFQNGNALFPVDYNFDFNSWSGWSISTMTDVTTPGFMNQYSSITGGGNDGSLSYAVAFVNGQNIIELRQEAVGEIVTGFYITNGTYPYLSMLEGDGFAKNFGGETGDDPDYLKLTIKKYLNGVLGPDSIDFYLADYRFADNSQDYIVDEWTYVDLIPLGAADSLVFTMSSTDNSPMFGMNTPAYFCIDDFETSDGTITSTQEPHDEITFRIFPNPAKEFIVIDTKEFSEGTLKFYNSLGALVMQEVIRSDRMELEIAALPSGNYFIQLETSAGVGIQKLVKQ